MDNNSVATLVGLAAQTVGTIMQSYATFKQSNIEKYFGLLLKEGKDLSNIGQNERLKGLFYNMIDHVAQEVQEEKLSNWKNLTIKLASDLSNLDFSENMVRMLDELTPFDLTILFAIYTTDFEKRHFQNELINYFEKRSIRSDYVYHSLKRLAVHNLVTEEAEGTGYISGEGENDGQAFLYKTNDLGKGFLEAIS
jgi:hypothetical protein